ncbi:MAG: 6-pyruvoyl trahydropterin synthase family protein [Actinomycetota bacterium]
MTYEVGAATSLRAMHVMPVEGPEGELHAHDYRVEVTATRSELDASGMVVDLDVLRAAMAAILEPLRDTDLGSIAPAEAEGVTVEVFARWVHDALADALAAEGANALGVRVWESAREFAGYAADLRAPERGAAADA